MTCRIRECVRETPLVRYLWWRTVEPAFIAAMIGRYLNDGRGSEPPSAEAVCRDLQILDKVKRHRRMNEIEALVAMVDRARRKRDASTAGQEERG